MNTSTTPPNKSAKKSWRQLKSVKILGLSLGLVTSTMGLVRAEWIPASRDGALSIQVEFTNGKMVKDKVVVSGTEPMKIRIRVRNEGEKTVKIWSVQSILYADTGGRLSGNSASPEFQGNVLPSQTVSFDTTYTPEKNNITGIAKVFFSYRDEMDRPLNAAAAYPVPFTIQ